MNNGSWVTLDWDLFPMVLARERILEMLNDKNLAWWVREVRYRRSAGGNGVHVLLSLRNNPNAKQKMYIRAAMGDDMRRWCWNFDLLESNNTVVDYSCGVAFDVKDGKRAGPWHLLRSNAESNRSGLGPWVRLVIGW